MPENRAETRFAKIARSLDFQVVFGQRAISVTNNYLDCYLR